MQSLYNYGTILLSVANGIYQNTIYGVAAKLPFKYTGAVVLGSVSWGLFYRSFNFPYLN